MATLTFNLNSTLFQHIFTPRAPTTNHSTQLLLKTPHPKLRAQNSAHRTRAPYSGIIKKGAAKSLRDAFVIG